VAKINPIKVKQDADKLEKAGRLDQAIVLYRQVVEDNPRDWNTINKIGDLYAKMNKVREASQEYAKVADFYARDGFLLKAIAIWRKINKLDTSAPEPYLSLADLYAKQGLMMEAKSHYQIVVDEYIKRGKTREAGDVLKKMAEIDPGDLKVRSKLADIYTREGSSGKAVDEHIAIAEELHKKGHLAEALQVLEKGLKLDPSSSRLRSELARIHLVQRSYDKAAHYLEEALKGAPNDPQILSRLGEAHLGAKKIQEAEAIFKRLLALNPDDDDARAQMARVYLQQGQLDHAFDQLQPVVNRLLERKDAARAATLLQQIVQKNPSHAKSLQKLVDVYRAGQNETALVTTYSQLAEAYINQKDFGQAATALEALVQREPQNQQHRTKLDFVKSKLGGRAAPAPAGPSSVAEPMPELIEEEFDLSQGEAASNFDIGISPPAPAPVATAPGRTTRPAARPSIEASGPLSDDDKEFIEEHLGEGRVFRKYGLIDKAADQFEAVVARFPDNVDSRKELLEVYKEKGLNAKVAEQSLALAEIFRLKGDVAAAESHEAEAQRLAPEMAPPPPARAPAPAPTAAPAARPAANPAAPPARAPKAPAADEGELMFEEHVAPIASTDEEEISLDVEESEAAAPAAAEDTSIDLGVDVGGDEDLPARFFEDDAAAAAPPAHDELAIESSPADDLVLEEEPAPPPPPPPLKAAPARPVAAKAPAAPAKAAAKAAPGGPVVPADLQRVLEEVEQYVSLGFIDDAKEALREVSARHPGHPAIQAQLTQLGLDLAEEPETAAAPAEESLEDSLGGLGGEEFPSTDAEASVLFSEPADAAADLSAGDSGLDLSDELGELFGAQAAVEEDPTAGGSTDLGDAGLADIFKEFKKGVDKQLGKEDYDTRYNLGIAYKEMGLLDEAIAEFQLAAKDEARLLECSSMLGICFMEKGMPKLAVKWFEKGLQAPGRNEEEYAGLRYDLAMAYEADGETKKALSLFTDLYGQDANFRDVAAKVRELRGAVG
jgi:tetratricopeptide (TPR) repeat protein